MTIIVSYIGFFLVWSVYTALGGFHLQNEFASWALSLSVHVICWPIFAVLLLITYGESVPTGLKKMLRTAPNLRILLPLSAIALAYNFICWKLNPGGFGNNMKPYDLIVTILTVGFFEEILFRGWFQNAISRFCSERKANLIAAALFTLIHYPKWILHGCTAVDLIMRTAQLFLLALVFGWVFRKNKSIWACAILHSLWDGIVFLF